MFMEFFEFYVFLFANGFFDFYGFFEFDGFLNFQRKTAPRGEISEVNVDPSIGQLVAHSPMEGREFLGCQPTTQPASQPDVGECLGEFEPNCPIS